MEFGFKQKHAFTNQKKCTKTQNKHKKTKDRFSHLLRHLAWKWRGPILISLILMSLATYLDTYPLTYSLGTHSGRKNVETWSAFGKVTGKSIQAHSFDSQWKNGLFSVPPHTMQNSPATVATLITNDHTNATHENCR